jgi:hypothetical protein
LYDTSNKNSGHADGVRMPAATISEFGRDDFPRSHPFFNGTLVTVYSFAGGRIEDENPILAATIEVKHTRDRSSDRVE